MSNGHIILNKSSELHGTIELTGAKNAVLVIIASLILANGKSVLENVPNSADVQQMIALLTDLGAQINFDIEKNRLEVDTSTINRFEVKQEIMNKMRASILVMGPLLARFGRAKVALPGGCLIGARPINYHLVGFKRMGVSLEEAGAFLNAVLSSQHTMQSHNRIILEYPSVGATENLMMFATLVPGETYIINAALEPEVLDLVDVLRKMGAKIEICDGMIIRIKGVDKLNPINHSVIPDRLEAGALLLAACITKGQINLPTARADHMDIFIEKLREMGHEVTTGTNPSSELGYNMHQGITAKATKFPKAVSFKTGPYPGFPTDLQAPTMAALCIADGVSIVEETVFENRMMHGQELQKMGAQISIDRTHATIRGVEMLYGAEVIATDIRASCALVLAGLVAVSQTKITGIHHWRRGYEKLERKIKLLGGNIEIFDEE